jgi:hypothetical protein
VTALSVPQPANLVVLDKKELYKASPPDTHSTTHHVYAVVMPRHGSRCRRPCAAGSLPTASVPHLTCLAAATQLRSVPPATATAESPFRMGVSERSREWDDNKSFSRQQQGLEKLQSSWMTKQRQKQQQQQEQQQQQKKCVLISSDKTTRTTMTTK